MASCENLELWIALPPRGAVGKAESFLGLGIGLNEIDACLDAFQGAAALPE
jgi:hypothetical protein